MVFFESRPSAQGLCGSVNWPWTGGMSLFNACVSALCYSIIEEQGSAGCQQAEARNSVVQSILRQFRQIPDYLQFPLKVLTLLFLWSSVLRTGRQFHQLEHAARWRQIEQWRRSRIGPKRDLMRFYESLVIFGWYSETSGRA